MNSRTKMPMDVPISTREPKRIVNQSIAKPLRRTVTLESTNQKPRHTTRKLHEHVSKACSWWYPKFTPPRYKWKPKSQIGNVNPNVSMPLGNASRTANILEPMTPRRFTVSNTVSLEKSNKNVIGIDNDIYSTVDACPNACEMWKVIVRLKQGESINVQDLETNLYWEFGKLTSQDGESLELYYSRFYKMMNELIRNQCKVTNHQVNVQFLLQLQPEWQSSVTLVKQSQELKTVSYHKLYDILKQHQHEVNEIRAEKIASVANLLALAAQQQPAYHP
nr:hypothetical protein [Tanacetum cinerariifolium]